MLYDYRCDKCEHFLEDVYQSIQDNPLTLCPNCGKDSLERVIYGGIGHFVKDVKTIGQLADSNWNKLGHYKKSEVEENSKKKRQGETSAFSAHTPASKTEINKMTNEQKQKYIITGEK